MAEEEDTAALPDPDAPDLEGARIFLESFQEARQEGRMSEVRSHLHPEALLFLDGRRVDWHETELADTGLFAPGAGLEPWRLIAEEPSVLDGAVVFVLGYPSEATADTLSPSDAPSDSPSASAPSVPTETLLLRADSVGWTIPFLQRISSRR